MVRLTQISVEYSPILIKTDTWANTGVNIFSNYSKIFAHTKKFFPCIKFNFSKSHFDSMNIDLIRIPWQLNLTSNLSNYLRLHVCLSFRLYLRSLHFRILSCITKWSFLKILKFNGCNCNHCTISTMPLLYQIRESKLYTYWHKYSLRIIWASSNCLN